MSYYPEGDEYSTHDLPSRPEIEADWVSARGRSTRRIVGHVVAGAAGGSVFAFVEHLGPELLGRSVLRWVFLYALLGGVAAGVWNAATGWLATGLSLSRREAVIASGLVAGFLLGGAALLVGTLNLTMEANAHLLIQLPWKEGLGGFAAGAVGGGLWRFLLRP